MALSGSFRTTGYSTNDGTPDYATFSWTGTQSIEGNYTDIAWSLKVGGGASSGYWNTVYNRQVKINDTSVGSGSSAKTVYNGTVLLSGTTRVNHASDGKGSFKVYAGVGFYSSGTYNSTATQTFTLDTIPRASSISSISNDKMVLNGSNALTVNISRASDSFTHTVKFQFGSSFSYSATGQGTSCKYVIPLSWLAGFGATASGTRTGTVTVTTYSGSTQIGSAVSKNFTLTSPSASAISWNTTNLVCNGTNTIGVSIVPTVSSFTHTVKWAFGSYTYSATGVGLSTSYAPPTSWLNAIQNANSGTGSVTVTTFNGTQQIGSAVSKNFTMSVPSYSPSFSSVTTSVVQPTSISNWTMYVQNHSKVKFTFNGVAGVYGSQIKSYAVTINGSNYSGTSNTITSNTLTSSGSLNYTATVTDSRGKTATKTGTISVQSLVKPAFSSATISRYNGTTTDDEGTQVYFKFSYTFGSYSNFNSCTNEIYYKVSTASSYTKYGTFTNGTALVISSVVFDITKSYDFRVIVTDKLGNALQYNYTIGTAKGLIDVDGVNNSIGLLKMASKKGAVEVGGVLEVDEQSRLYGGSYNHSFLSNAGGSYIKFATVTITQAYADNSISFDLIGRSWVQKASVSMYFQSDSGKDPNLVYIGVWGRNVKIYGVKTATSTWDLYCYDSWGYERFTIYNLASPITLNQLNNQVLKYYEIDWHNIPVATLPSGAVASETSYYYDSTYHVFNKPAFYLVNQTLRRCVSSDNMTHVRMIDGTKKYLEIASSLGTYGIDAWVSDVTLKENITETDVNNALDLINRLRHVQFDWKSNGEHVEIGYIADELEDVFEQLVFEVPQYDEEGNPTGENVKQIYNTTMIPLITKAIQELSSRPSGTPIGTIVITDSNLPPAQVGTWKLIDKEFKPQLVTGEFAISTAKSCVVTASLSGHSIELQIKFEASSTIDDATVTIGTLNPTSVGVTAFAQNLYPTGSSDGGGAVPSCYFSKSGLFQVLDGSASGGTLASGQATYVIMTLVNDDFNKMIDSFCNKFYWKRVEEEDDSTVTVTDDGYGNVTITGATVTDDGNGNLTIEGITFV